MPAVADFRKAQTEPGELITTVNAMRIFVFLPVMVAMLGVIPSLDSATAADLDKPGHSVSRMALSGAQPTTISLSWEVVSSGGTDARIGSLILRGTAMQTAVGEVTSPNYRVRQGFWQHFFEACLVGDANGNGQVGIADAVFLINYIFVDGKAPDKFCTGDANSDGIINISDVVKLLHYVFQY